MKVLFVCSGNNNGISNIVAEQARLLKKSGVAIEFYPIQGKGAPGYLKNIPKLFAYLQKNRFDLVHAHYSFSGYVAALARARPLVVSLMGSDVNRSPLFSSTNSLFSRLSWNATIVKSPDMLKSRSFKNMSVIPNGVDTGRFTPMDQAICQHKLGWDSDKFHVLFPANPSRPEKNYALAKQAIHQVSADKKIVLHELVNVRHEDIPVYMNASDLILLTSKWEGSPNVIKEAMACNRPIVSTDVGDVRHLFGDVSGYFLSTHKPGGVTDKLQEAIVFCESNGSAEGRRRILSLGLNSEAISERIVTIYNQVSHGERRHLALDA